MQKDFITKYRWPLAIIIIILIIAGWIGGMYNSFVTLEQDVNGKWSEVENQYQRQADAIPLLVATVSSAVNVEIKMIENVTATRSKWQTSSGQYGKDVAGLQMNNAITAFVSAVATAENYPVLQANKNYLALQDELVGTQNRLAVARGRYITSIQAYNTAVQRVPGVWFAGMFGFAPKDYYQATPEAMKTPVIGPSQLP